MIKLKFRGKMLLSIILSVVVVAGTVQYFINYKASEVVLNYANDTIKAKVEGVKSHIESQLKMDKMVSKIMAGDKRVIDAASGKCKGKDDNPCNEMLKGVVADNNSLEVIIVVDKDGTIVASNSKGAIGVSVKNREYFKESIKGKVLMTDVIRSKETGNALFGISCPVKSEGKVIGVLFVGNKMDYLYHELIAPITAGRTGYTFVNDKNGVLLAHPDPKLVLDKDFPNRSNATTNVVKNGVGMMRYWWEPIKGYKISQIALTDNGWYISLTVPETEMLESLEVVNLYSLVGGFILIAVISIIVFFLIGAVSKVLTVLNNLILNLAEGRINIDEDQEKDLQKAIARTDEFGEMSQAVLSIQKYFEDMAGIARSVANKDLDVEVHVRSSDDILGNALAEMMENFNSAFAQVNTSVLQVNSGAHQVSSASQALSTGATQQAAAIEEITASVSEMDTQTNLNAENAETANQYTVEANAAAVNGQEQMSNLSKAMETMSSRASEVQKIIKTIDDIAFQTNLLALNAAVEAARAGTHGKGFAVVAEEVRNLAARSAKAAGETAELIENVVKEINHGNIVTEQTAESLNNIVEGINKSTDLIGEIATATTEQSDGMKQIGVGLRQIEQVTQSNTASSEQTASASEEMTGMSNELKNLIGEFKLAGSHSGHNKVKKKVRKSLSAKQENTMSAPTSRSAEVVQPNDVINLDDSEFGKF